MIRTGISVVAVGLSLCGSVQAAFESRLSGQAYYDTALNITWLAGATACTDNEYGHHFHLSGIDSMNSAPFSNVGTVNYWSATADGSNAWLFDFTFNDGSQFTTSQTFKALAWAVHDGDIALVPLPAAAWLFGSGLVGLVGLSRKRRR